jgi:hypothetical protein
VRCGSTSCPTGGLPTRSSIPERSGPRFDAAQRAAFRQAGPGRRAHGHRDALQPTASEVARHHRKSGISARFSASTTATHRELGLGLSEPGLPVGLPSMTKLAPVMWRAMFPYLPQQPGYHKRLKDAQPLLCKTILTLAACCPSWFDDVWMTDATPVPCGASRETVKRSDLAGHAGYGYCASHSRWPWPQASGTTGPPTPPANDH